MIAKKILKLDEPFEISDDDILAEDETLHCVVSQPPPVSSVRVVIVDDRDSERTIQRQAPTYAFTELDGSDEFPELENVDETRVYTPSEWELIKTLLEVL